MVVTYEGSIYFNLPWLVSSSHPSPLTTFVIIWFQTFHLSLRYVIVFREYNNQISTSYHRIRWGLGLGLFLFLFFLPIPLCWRASPTNIMISKTQVIASLTWLFKLFFNYLHFSHFFLNYHFFFFWQPFKMI